MSKSKSGRAASRQDATVRNVRAATRRDKKTNTKISTIAERVEELEAQVGRLTSALRHLATV